MLRFLPRSNAPPPLSISVVRPSHLPSTKQWQSHLPWQWQRDFNILAIETSCDDTCVAVLNLEPTERGYRATKLLFNERKTSNNLQYGGIHPLRAMESHHTHLAPMVHRALHHMSSKWKQKLDLIAVTKGPGMRNNLQSGIDVAKGLSIGLGVPMMGIHHMHAHALTARMQYALSASGQDSCRPRQSKEQERMSFPMLSLLVSGGHTLLVQSADLVEHRIAAATADIAVGDCLDKVARLVLPRDVLASAKSVSYGELLEFFAFDQKWEPSFPSRSFKYKYDAPRTAPEMDLKWTSDNQYGWHVPMPFRKQPSSKVASQSLAFSFSGIVSQVERIVKYGNSHSNPRTSPMPIEEARELGRAAMEVAFEHLADRVCQTIRSASEGSQEANQDVVDSGVTILDNDKEATQLSSANAGNKPSLMNTVHQLAIGGGVAANQYLSHVLKHYAEAQGIKLNIAKTSTVFCTDNAAMIAWAAAEMIGVATAPRGFKLSSKDFRRNLSMRPLRKWSLENLMSPEKEEERERLEELERDRRQLARSKQSVNMGDGLAANGEDLAAAHVDASASTAAPTSTESLDCSHGTSASDSLSATTWEPHSTFGDAHDSILPNVMRIAESEASTVEAPLTKRARVAKRARERAAALEAAATNIRVARKQELCVAQTPNPSSSSQLAEMLARMQDSSARPVGDVVEDDMHGFEPTDPTGHVDLQSTEVTDSVSDSAWTDNITDEEIELIIKQSRADIDEQTSKCQEPLPAGDHASIQDGDDPDALNKRVQVFKKFDDGNLVANFPAAASQRNRTRTKSDKARKVCNVMSRALVNPSDADAAAKTSLTSNRLFDIFAGTALPREITFDFRKAPQLISRALSGFVAQAVQERFPGRSARARHDRIALLAKLQRRCKEMSALRVEIWNENSMTVKSEKHADQDRQPEVAAGAGLRVLQTAVVAERMLHRLRPGSDLAAHMARWGTLKGLRGDLAQQTTSGDAYVPQLIEKLSDLIAQKETPGTDTEAVNRRSQIAEELVNSSMRARSLVKPKVFANTRITRRNKEIGDTRARIAEVLVPGMSSEEVERRNRVRSKITQICRGDFVHPIEQWDDASLIPSQISEAMQNYLEVIVRENCPADEADDEAARSSMMRALQPRKDLLDRLRMSVFLFSRGRMAELQMAGLMDTGSQFSETWEASAAEQIRYAASLPENLSNAVSDTMPAAPGLDLTMMTNTDAREPTSHGRSANDDEVQSSTTTLVPDSPIHSYIPKERLSAYRSLLVRLYPEFDLASNLSRWGHFRELQKDLQKGIRPKEEVIQAHMDKMLRLIDEADMPSAKTEVMNGMTGTVDGHSELASLQSSFTSMVHRTRRRRRTDLRRSIAWEILPCSVRDDWNQLLIELQSVYNGNLLPPLDEWDDVTNIPHQISQSLHELVENVVNERFAGNDSASKRERSSLMARSQKLVDELAHVMKLMFEYPVEGLAQMEAEGLFDSEDLRSRFLLDHCPWTAPKTPSLIQASSSDRGSNTTVPLPTSRHTAASTTTHSQPAGSLGNFGKLMSRLDDSSFLDAGQSFPQSLTSSDAIATSIGSSSNDEVKKDTDASSTTNISQPRHELTASALRSRARRTPTSPPVSQRTETWKHPLRRASARRLSQDEQQQGDTGLIRRLQSTRRRSAARPSEIVKAPTSAATKDHKTITSIW